LGSVAELFFNVYRFFMAAPARVGLTIAGLILLAFVVIYIALFFTLKSAQFRSLAQTELSQRSSLDVQLGSLSLGFPFRLVAENVKISKQRGFSFTADRLSATFNPLDLPARTLHRLRVEKPVLRLDMQQLTASQDQTVAALALRYLNVHDGTIVLIKGDQHILELPQIDLQAENINLGQQAGVNLRADVPALNGVAQLVIKGHPREFETAVVIRAKQNLPGFGAESVKAPELLRLDAKIRALERQAEATIDSKFHNLGTGESKLTGTLAARIEVDPNFHDAEFTGHATLADFPGTLAPGISKLPRGNAQASFAGVFSLPQKKLTLTSVRLASHLGSGAANGEMRFDPLPNISQARLHWQEMPLEKVKMLLPPPLDRWAYQGQARIEGEIRGPWRALDIRGIARSENAQVHGAGLKTASLSMVLPFAWMPPALQIDGAKLNIAKLDYTWPNRWQTAAERLHGTASLAISPHEPLSINGRFETAGGKFNSPDNDKIGENLALNGSFEWTSRPKAGSYGFDVKFAVDTGEILWGKFFTDLKPRQPTFVFDAAYFNADDRLECRRCEVSLANVGTITASGAVAKLTQTPELRLQARSAQFLPGGLFEYFLRENLNREFPFLDQLSVGGELAFATQVRGSPDDLTTTGELSLKSGQLRSRSNQWQVGPLTLNLPFEIHWAQTIKNSIDPPRTGALAIERARFGKQSLGTIRTSISLAHNALRFHEVVRAAVFGGEIIVRDLFWPDVITDPKRLSFSLETKGLELAELTEALDWPRFSGTLTGSIPEVQSTSNTLKTNGGIQAQLFGGRIAMSKLEIDNPFSSLAAIRLDANLTNIQLEQLSKTFAFGHISGILAGTIDDLVIIDGQPAQFRADLYSVDRGGEQRISVEALNKITVLSSGQNAGALYGGLAGFFDSFRYSKLGFKAFLKNDRLTLRGVETRGDQEYLVVGSFLPPTVNIVSHTQVIAFSDLLRRLERIKSEKPEVK
jgi:hypothetical protein